MNKELKTIIKEITDEGYEVMRTKGGHYAVRSARGNLIYSLPSTPGRGRAISNLRASLIRIGVLPRK